DNTGNYNLDWVGYDKNSNIIALLRVGYNNAAMNSFGAVDNLVYTYADGGNQLESVKDRSHKDYGFIDSATDGVDYVYDANGNLTSDANKNITNILYNHLNLPIRVTVGGSNLINYIYDANGIKLEKQLDQPGNFEVTQYAGNYIYKNNQLEFFKHPEGYIKPTNNSWRYVYQYKDHLGNVRLSYTEDPSNPGQPTIIEENNFYPFGLKHRGYNINVSPLGNDVAQKWKYNGQEFSESLGLNLYEMDMRQYDPALGRFNVIDPLTHHSMSPYNAFDNNPIFWADPSGADATSLIMDLFNKSGSGFTQYTNTGNGNFEESARATDEDVANGKAILVAFPDQNPEIPENQKTARWFERNFGDGNEKIEGAGHAGIVLIDGESGTSRYFDFGRYGRPDIPGSRGVDEGAVRSSANYRGLSIPNWNFELSNEENVDRIVNALHNSPVFKGYGTIMASLAEGLDYKAMLKYAQEMEAKGYHAFGGYGSSTNCNNPTYCAKFARGVAEAGGFNWTWYVLTGKANVEDVNRTNRNGIKTIKD
ncbi:MAG: DUF6695 family protein, partial [Bacteroidota bacterium]